MLHLLAIEWLKIKKYRTFWILITLFAALLVIWNYVVAKGIFHIGAKGINILNTDYTFPDVWNNVGFYTKLFSGLIAVVMVILVTNEFQFRTNRQNVIDGLSRSQVFHAKWLLVATISLATTLLTFLLGLIFALSNGDNIGDCTRDLVRVLYVLIMTLNYFSFAMTLSFFLKKSGMAIILFLLYLYVIETLLMQLFDHKVYKYASNFFPLQSGAELFDLPLMLKEKRDVAAPTQQTLAIVSVGWILIYYIIGRIRMLKSDW